jgi:hypothetical protein
MTSKPIGDPGAPTSAAGNLREEDLIAEVDFDGLPRGPAESEDDLDLIELVRRRLDLGEEVSDVTIAASLAAISGKDDPRGRWLAAFGSPLGKRLASRGTDINAAITSLVALSDSRAA